MEMTSLVGRDGTRVPLEGVGVVAKVLGAHTEVTVKQRYRNRESRAIEAIYTFPLPSDATLTAFAMVCEGRRLDGEVQEREKAFQTYDDALVGGHGAALVEQERTNVFTANVGNLLPGEETIIEVSYVQRLRADEGAIRWSLPTLVAPRYIPGAASGDRTAHGHADPTRAVPDADRITPKIGDVDYGLSIDLEFQGIGDAQVECPSHALAVSRTASGVRVQFTQREVPLDRDVVITARGRTKAPLTSLLAHRERGGDGFFALSIVPDLLSVADPKRRQRIVFLVDTSGSMEGLSIGEAQAALQLCLRHLREGDEFELIEFNSAWTSFAGRLTRFGEKSLKEADQWVRGLRASGGTELLTPLVEAVRLAGDGIVVLITDGQVGNEQQIVEEVMRERRGARVLSFGIGTNVSDALLRNLARLTDGAVEQIYPGERIDEKVVAQFGRAISPRVTELSIDWQGVEVGELAPSELPAMVDADPWVIFGRYAAGGTGRAHVRGRLDGRAFQVDVDVDLPENRAEPAIAKLWGAERIRSLEAQEVTGRRAGAMKDRITRIALEQQIVCAHTSFVVVEKRAGARRMSGAPEARAVPVNAPHGWAMFETQRRAKVTTGSMPSFGGAAPPPPPRSAPAPVYAMPMTAMLDLGAVSDHKAQREEAAAMPAKRMLSRDQTRGAVAGPQAPKGGAPRDEVVEILSAQLASGLWETPGKKGDLGRLAATVERLTRLVELGVTTAHPTHGAQLKKAVEALLTLVEALVGADPDAVKPALEIAWRAAVALRLRERINATVTGARLSNVTLAP